MKRLFNKIFILKFFFISFSILIVLNIIFGNKNLVALKNNFDKFEIIKKNYSHLMNEYNEVKFIHDQFKNNNLELDYGYTIITKHKFNDKDIYALYGHLSKSSISNKKIRQKIFNGCF